jgi:2-polyprenyl-3-methyl-5-hydroxy-6-metoxy-1,4-benzoquinol methylase
MNKQILTDTERQSIRSDLYSRAHEEVVDVSDKKIAFFMRHTLGKKVLDLGCVDHNENNWKSRYWLHKAIKLSAESVRGLDYYSEGVEKLRGLGFDVVEGDAQSFKFDSAFDVVTAGDLIEHLPNLDGFFKSINGALDIDGKVVITTPNPWCWKYAGYHTIFRKLLPINREHVSWFCLQTLENLIGRYGFVLIDFEYSSRRGYERWMPLPSHIKHTTLGVVLKKIKHDG